MLRVRREEKRKGKGVEIHPTRVVPLNFSAVVAPMD